MPTLFESSQAHTGGSVQSGKQTTAPSGSPVARTKKSLGPLTCFAVNPEGMRFETQEKEETVVLFLRQHIIVTVPWVIVACILLLVPSVLFPFVFHTVTQSLNIPTGFIILFTLVWYLATFGYILAKFIGWFFNIYIVTNERLVDIDFYYLLYKHFSEADLSKIQDISFTASGILSTIFNFGTIVVETAGESPNLEFEMVPHPERVVETIRSLIEKRTA